MIQIGCPVEIKMVKMMLEGEKINSQGYFAEILEYKPLTERIYLVLREGHLEDISLDAVYECSIEEEREPKLCYGVIIERFKDKRGDIVVFQLENGYYKKNLK